MSNWMMSRSSVMSMAKTHTWPLVRKYNPSQYTICLEVALSYNPSLGDISLCKTLRLKNPFALDDLLISWHIYQSPSFVLQQRFIFILHCYLPLFLLWARDIFSTSVWFNMYVFSFNEACKRWCTLNNNRQACGVAL